MIIHWRESFDPSTCDNPAIKQENIVWWKKKRWRLPTHSQKLSCDSLLFLFYILKKNDWKFGLSLLWRYYKKKQSSLWGGERLENTHTRLVCILPWHSLCQHISSRLLLSPQYNKGIHSSRNVALRKWPMFTLWCLCRLGLDIVQWSATCVCLSRHYT